MYVCNQTFLFEKLNSQEPSLFEIPKLEASIKGFISVIEDNNTFNFDVKRVFWIYDTPENAVRGEHAHLTTQQILIAVNGKVDIKVEKPDGTMFSFVLDRPNVGLYVPHRLWHTIKYSKNTVLLVLASTEYNENDYIRSYQDFKNLVE